MITRLLQLISLMALLALQLPVAAGVLDTTYYHNDALGSPVAATKQDGSLLWREEYNPYGEKRLNEDEAADKVNSRGYTNHLHDRETELTYMGARYYDPVVGRFMGVGPVGFTGEADTFNRYSYVANNPYIYRSKWRSKGIC